MDVKPWEPMFYGWSQFASFPWWARDLGCSLMDDVNLVPEGMKVTLANGQRIIVRALSEERKAARRARREAPK